MQQRNLTISEIANLYGVSFRTLRFYEQCGLLQPARIGVDRYYSPRDRIIIELILKGKRLGFTLAEIERLLASSRKPADSAAYDITAGLSQEQILSRIENLTHKTKEIDDAITELRSIQSGRSE